jgi:hypothetical protein
MAITGSIGSILRPSHHRPPANVTPARDYEGKANTALKARDMACNASGSSPASNSPPNTVENRPENIVKPPAAQAASTGPERCRASDGRSRSLQKRLYQNARITLISRWVRVAINGSASKALSAIKASGLALQSTPLREPDHRPDLA